MQDDFGEHVKTVYAHFGLAIYYGQVLEHGLANATFVIDVVPRASDFSSEENWSESVDEFFEGKFRQTLGRMIESFKKVTAVPDPLEKLLSDALEKRNWLAHHYFRERTYQFMSTAGREEMIAELEQIQELFQRADAALEDVAEPVRERYGYTKEILHSIREDMLREARNDL